MNDLLAFDWDSHEIRIVAAAAGGRRVRVTRVEVIPLPDDVKADDPEQLGQFLRRQLHDRGINAQAAIGCVSRRDVVLQQMNLPRVPAKELVKLIHFQVTSDLVSADHESTFDFVSYPARQGDGSLALIAIAASGRIQRIQQVAAAAGLTLRAIRFQSLASTSARQIWGTRHDSRESTSTEVLLTVADNHMEAIATRNGELLASLPVPIPEGTKDLTEVGRAAVNRLKVLVGSQTPALSLDAIGMGAPHGATWGERVASELGMPLLLFNPFEQSDAVSGESWDSLAALAGALALEATDPLQTIDFLHPRRPAAPHPLWKYRWTSAAAAVVLAIGGLGLRAYANLRALDEELRQLQSEVKSASSEVKKLRVYKQQQAVTRSWLEQRPLWLDEYQQLLGLLPDASDLYLTHVSFSQSSSKSGIGAIRLEGYAADELTVAETALRLARSGRYQVRPGGIVPISRGGSYPWRFETELVLLPRQQPGPREGTGDRNIALRK